jgi:hypothetical protein
MGADQSSRSLVHIHAYIVFEKIKGVRTFQIFMEERAVSQFFTLNGVSACAIASEL